MSRPTVYCAVGGSYSDYRVYAIFDNREAAEKFLRASDGEADDIEERTLYDSMPGRTTWHHITRMFRQDQIERGSIRTWDFDGPPFDGTPRRKGATYHKWEYGERVFGTDPNAVEKLWTEKHAAAEALKAGVS